MLDLYRDSSVIAIATLRAESLLSRGLVAPTAFGGKSLDLRLRRDDVKMVMCRIAAGLFALLDPRHLNRLQYFFARLTRVVIELRQLAHPLVQIGEADKFRINVGILVAELNRDFQTVSPFQRHQ